MERLTSYGSSGHGNEPPRPDRDRDGPPTHEPPDNEVPNVVPVSAVLGRTPDAAVALVGLRVYTTGFSFDVSVRLRVPAEDGDASATSGLLDFYVERTGSEPRNRLLFGVEYADGRVGTNLGFPHTEPPDDVGDRQGRPPLMLFPHGGSGGERTYDATYWLTPLPPPGPLTFVCAWEAFGITEARFSVDGASVADAGRHANVLWAWEPERPRRRPRPPAALPESRWFADVMRGRLRD